MFSFLCNLMQNPILKKQVPLPAMIQVSSKSIMILSKKTCQVLARFLGSFLPLLVQNNTEAGGHCHHSCITGK